MTMISEIRFEHASWWWILLVPPLVLGLLHLWAWRFRKRALATLRGRTLVLAMIEGRSTGRRVGVAVLVVLGLEMFLLAGLRPRYGLREVTVVGAGVDVAVVLDVSRSMKVADIAPDRLTAATIEISRVLDGMPGNRVTLIPFAGLAFIQTPLTLDHEVVKEYLASLKVTDIPVPGTALGRGLRVASTALGLDKEGSRGSTHKVILAFTDGENHEGEPEKVAEELASKGVRVYTVGVGTPAGQPVPILDEQGRVVGASREQDGVTPVLSRLNEDLLRSIATKTGGRYFALTSVGSVAEDLLRELATIEKAEYQARIERLLEDRFQYPLGAGIAVLVVAFILLGHRRRTGPIAAVVLCLVASPVEARSVFEKAHGGVEAALERLRAGEAGDAAKALQDLASELPDRPDLLMNLALALDATGRYEEAVQVMDQALQALARARKPHEDWPSRARLLHAKGTILAHQARKMEGENKAPREVRPVWRQAVEALSEALILDPDARDTQRNLEICAMAAYPPCAKMDDRREPNETPGEAPFLTPDPNTATIREDLTLCPDNEDWFRLPLRAGETLVARVLEPSVGGAGGPTPGTEQPARVELALLDAGERPLGPPGKQTRFTAREAIQVLLKVVGPKDEDGIPYVLDGRLIPPCPAGDDAQEDNDVRDAARPIEDGDHSFRICPGDDDWFQYVEKQGTQKEVTLQVPAGEGPLELEVFLADGAPLDIARAASQDGGETLLARLPKAEQDAPFLIRVFGGGNQGFYVLSIRDPQGGQNPNRDQGPPRERPQPQGQQTMREQLDAIDRNDENLEAREAARRFPAREYVPEKDW